MNWFIQTMGSSIGKKVMMALTGLSFIGFLSVHLIGNLTILGGKDAFNSYAEHLHSMGAILKVPELGLLTSALIHITTGVLLFWQNFRARPQRYVMNIRAGGRTIGSATMPYTGFFLLLFVLCHLLSFHFVDKSHTTIFQIVSTAFANPLYVAFYIVAMVVLGFHVSHGFWSLFQTLGANHPKYFPLVKGLGLALSVIFGVGFGFIPVYFAFMV